MSVSISSITVSYECTECEYTWEAEYETPAAMTNHPDCPNTCAYCDQCGCEGPCDACRECGCDGPCDECGQCGTCDYWECSNQEEEEGPTLVIAMGAGVDDFDMEAFRREHLHIG